MLQHVNSRPFTTQCQIAWPRPGEDFIHDRGTFQKTTGLRSFYVIHPDWLSEDVNRPQTRGRARRPWPWEFPGARATYATPVERLRNRLLSDNAVAEETRRLSQHQAYQVKHSSPWDVNNPDENPQSNSLYKRPSTQPHTLPWNNARRILMTELSQLSIEDRFRSGDISHDLHRNYVPSLRQRSLSSRIPSQSAIEAARFRQMSNSYRTYCDWQ